MRRLFKCWKSSNSNGSRHSAIALAAAISVVCSYPMLVTAEQLPELYPGFAENTTAQPVFAQARAGFAGDSDNDSVPDIIDVDDDNDTIPDEIEGTADADNDGIADCLDLDSDNDGIPDLVEATAGTGLLALIDADQDGKLDANVAVGENGLVDLVELSLESATSITGATDLDGDGIRDHQDLDTDNDGIPDVVEAGSSDTNFDGLYDFFLDLNGDGLADRLSTSPIKPSDTDNDGVEDFRDLDSDQDGLSDRLETNGTDVDSDGRVDNFIDVNVDGLHDDYSNQVGGLPDTDQDGFPDYRDTDSDGDGVSDAEEAFPTTVPSEPIVPTTPFTPTPTAPAEDLTLQTGESGSVFGCALSTGANPTHATDPLLMLMLGLAFVGLLRRRTNRAGVTSSSNSSLFSITGAAAIVLLSGCASAPAGNSLDNSSVLQPYAGIGLGASFLNANTEGLPLEQDESFSAAGQLTLGLATGKNLAFELRAADLGQATFISGEAVGYQVADVSALYQKRFSKLSGFGRIGAGALFNDGDIETSQKNKTHLLVGFGAEYALNPQLALRAEWQGHDVDVMHSQLSILYRFGAAKRKRAVIATNTTAADSPQTVAKADFQEVPKKTSKPQNTLPEQRTENTSAAAEKLTVLDARITPIPKINPETATVKPDPGRLKPLITVPIVRKKAPEPKDIDEDGIVDASDSCPGTSSGVRVFADGCAMFGESVPGLTFFPDTDRLTSSAQEVLDMFAEVLTNETDIGVTVAAHTRASTDPNAAMFLTRRRTIAIIRYLADKGIDATRLRPEAYGDTQPLAGAKEISDNDRVVLSQR